jgi:hypothetical protein
MKYGDGRGVAWRVESLRWWVVFGRSERRRGTDVTGKAISQTGGQARTRQPQPSLNACGRSAEEYLLRGAVNRWAADGETATPRLCCFVLWANYGECRNAGRRSLTERRRDRENQEKGCLKRASW